MHFFSFEVGDPIINHLMPINSIYSVEDQELKRGRENKQSINKAYGI
jgi:hypothetical protein